ncbi:MAG TPA: polysaccharide deacetylase family protein, partial [Longilinea sp.]|nr:polysaccharide deacetylase family protein [Longilinea sp.]
MDLFQAPTATVTVTATATATAIPPTNTPTITPTPTVTPTPPELPGIFTTTILNPLDTPHTYIQNTCEYLRMKWDPNNSAPGTVVMPIMIHSITAGDATNDNQISATTFKFLIRDLTMQNFQAISMQQLHDFLYNNAKIPSRSVIFIVDDRHYAEYFNTYFKPLHDEYGWVVVNSWISATDTSQDLWDQNAELEKEGWVDHQAHGVVHNIPIGQYSTDDYIKGELYGSITAMQEHFNKTPIAYIWPGGGFTAHAVDIARQAGYELGFTVNPRGPLMFNWVPLADATDPNRPTYIEEGSVNDPLMVLPRYWDTDASTHIDQVRQIGQQAAAQAEQNKTVEMEYYNSACVNV